MASARKLDTALQITPFFHCTSRCVRGAFLCGINRDTGHDYTHRRQWLKNRLLELATIFSMELAAFAIMENHFHVVLKVDCEAIRKCSDRNIIQRWHRIFKGTELSRRYIEYDDLTSAESDALAISVARWRAALTDISWFMRCAKEPLARLANREDGCKGRFWEGRFHSQVLLDTQAVVACMTYVDLNPTRANMGEYPESDPCTSLHYRAQTVCQTNSTRSPLPAGLMEIDTNHEKNSGFTLPVSTLDYIELVDLVARQRRPNKKGALSSLVKPALQRLGIDKSSWQELEMRFKKHFHILVGGRDSVKNACKNFGQKSAWGQRHCQDFFRKSTPI